METYVLDKTFLSIGSIGTGVCVRMGLGTPTGMKNRVATLEGTANTIGTIPHLGISLTGCSKTGEQVIIRMLGIAKGKLRATQGSIIQGKPMQAKTHGKLMSVEGKIAVGKAGTTIPIIGHCVYAEGGGSADNFVDVMVNPQYI